MTYILFIFMHHGTLWCSVVYCNMLHKKTRPFFMFSAHTTAVVGTELMGLKVKHRVYMLAPHIFFNIPCTTFKMPMELRAYGIATSFKIHS